MEISLLRHFVFVLLAAIAIGCSNGGQSTDNDSEARNIILFIGDGMGAGQRKAAQWTVAGESGLLAMDDMTSTGYLTTCSAKSTITDSAAAATAMATGEKTNNGVVGMDVDLLPVSTILEEAKFQGRSVGLVTTTQITHATPAAFASHIEDRNLMTEIAIEILESEPDVLLGGGEDEFLPVSETGCHEEPGERDDGRNLISEAIGDEYIYVCNGESFASIDIFTTTKLIGLFADEGMIRPYVPSLAEMTTLIFTM